MKKTIFSLAALSLIAASCSDNTEITTPTIPVDPSAKEMISFSMTDEAGSPITRANTRC